jgi:hypothetical protein
LRQISIDVGADEVGLVGHEIVFSLIIGEKCIAFIWAYRLESLIGF